jgi:uncharacterized protein YciI
MENIILNEKPLLVFCILAETLEGWKDISSDEGKEVLLEHYQWGSELKKNRKLILAGPTDFELISSREINPIGHTTGLIMLNVSSREEAISWAERDPFHIHGFRKNVVHSLKITMSEK